MVKKKNEHPHLEGLAEQQIFRTIGTRNYLLAQRLHKQFQKLKPHFSTVAYLERPNNSKRILTICELRGSHDAVVATGTAWKSPQDENRPEVGETIAYSRAVRNFTGKRIGFLS